jgi:predicted  nucleic acid-binding Zn-ribbon protein
MGPTNLALVKLFQADQQLREAQARLDAATRDVRIQERKLNDLSERHRLAQTKLREAQAQSGQFDLDLRSRDAHIEKLRNQQQLAKTNKEYQAFLVEINTAKVDRNKVEEEAIRAMEQAERLGTELKELGAQVEAEGARLTSMREQIGDRIAQLQAEIDALRPAREEAAAAVPAKAREMFERMSERYEGEAMAAIAKPDRRREEYVCTSCNMDLVADVYNRLHARDDLVFCPSCRRILFIPEDLPVEKAVHKPKERKERAQKAPPAAIGRQTSAFDVMRSIEVESDEDGAGAGAAGAADAADAADVEPTEADAPQADTTPPEADREQPAPPA